MSERLTAVLWDPPTLRALYGSVIVACLLNALIRPVLRIGIDQGFAAGAVTLFGLNEIVLLALGIGIWRLMRDGKGPAGQRDVVIALLAVLALAMPFAATSWMVLGAASLAGAFEWSRRARGVAAGLVIIATAAIREPLTNAMIDLFAESVLTADTILSWAVLDLIGANPVRVGNLVAIPGTHALLVLSGCSSLTNLSLSLLAWMAVIVGLGIGTVGTRARILVVGGLGLAIVLVAINVSRLVLMALSPQIYTVVHDGWGAQAYLAATTLTVVAACIWGLDRDRRRSSFNRGAPCG